MMIPEFTERAKALKERLAMKYGKGKKAGGNIESERISSAN